MERVADALVRGRAMLRIQRLPELKGNPCQVNQAQTERGQRRSREGIYPPRGKLGMMRERIEPG